MWEGGGAAEVASARPAQFLSRAPNALLLHTPSSPRSPPAPLQARTTLRTMGAALARETWVTIKELQQSQAGMAHPAVALRQWLLEGPLPPATAAAAAAPAGVTTGPAVEAAVAPDAAPDSVAAEPAESTPAAEAAGAAAAEPSGSVSGAEEDGAGDIAEKWLAAEDVASPAPPAHATPEPASSTPAPAALINPNPKPKPKP